MKLDIIFIFYCLDPQNIKNSFFRANTQILKSECTTWTGYLDWGFDNYRIEGISKYIYLQFCNYRQPW